MGILKKLQLTWKTLPMKEKIGLVLDVISGTGCMLVSFSAGKALTKDCDPIKSVCIRTAVTGLGLAASDVASKALRENYAEPLGDIIERAKAKAAEEKMKEATAHE